MDPEIILLPYRRDPATGSLMPSISTGGAQRNPTIKKTEATDRSGNMRIPNQPIKIRLLVDKMKLEKVPQKELFEHEIKIALLFFILDFTSKARILSFIY